MSARLPLPNFRRYMTRDEYEKWVERVSKGFSPGEVVELDRRHVRAVMMASKGNVAVATPRHLFILVDLQWQPLGNLMDVAELRYRAVPSGARVVLEVLRSYPDRKFTLARTRVFRLEYRYVRGYEDFVVERENDRVEVEGAELLVTQGVRRRFQESGELVIAWGPGGFRMSAEARERRKLEERREQRIVWRVTDPSRPLGSFLKKYRGLIDERPSYVNARLLLFAPGIMVYARAAPGGIEVAARDIELPSEDELLEVSRFYTVFLPLYLYADLSTPPSRGVAILEMFRGGARHRVVLSDPDRAVRLMFRCLRNRYSTSSYARKILPRGVPRIFDDDPLFLAQHFIDGVAERVVAWTRMVREEILPRVRNLRSKPVKLKPLEAFLEAFYERAPRRKVENAVRPWLELFEKVKDLAPRATLYIVFYGKEVYGRRYRPNFVGLRVEKDGSVTVLGSRYVPVSGIVMKGGEFERLYREAYVGKLFDYQVVPTSEKLRILAEDVEEVRNLLRYNGVEPATASLEEVRAALRRLAEGYEGDNLVLLALQRLGGMRQAGAVPRGVNLDEVRKALLGLVKTGRFPEDYRRFAELGGLRVLRAVVKYEMKRRGYSIRKGVMFLGDPDEVRMRIMEVVRGIRGRLLALLEEGGAAEAREGHGSLIGVSARLAALEEELRV